MPTTLRNTDILFNDGSAQSTATGMITGGSVVNLTSSIATQHTFSIPADAKQILFVGSGGYSSGPSGMTLNARQSDGGTIASVNGSRFGQVTTSVSHTSVTGSNDLISGGATYWMPNRFFVLITKLPTFSSTSVAYVLGISSTAGGSANRFEGTFSYSSITSLATLVWNPGPYISGASAQVYWMKG